MKQFLIFLLLTTTVFGFDPPKGIADPADYFSTFGEIDQATPDWPASWTGPGTSATAGYYYIDKTDGAATDTGNTYGHPDVPRLSIPEGLRSAGDFIYIHAGNYGAGDSAGDRYDWHGPGTAAAPIWITGNPSTKPIISDTTHIGFGGSASYVVIENIQFGDGVDQDYNLRIYPQNDGDDIDHVIIRDCVTLGTQAVGDPGGIAVGLSSTTDSIPNSTVTDVVIYNCTISNLASKTLSDVSGIGNGYHTNRTWVLDCTIHDVGSDGIFGGHYSNLTTRLTENYFIGRNTVYDCGENSIDLKSLGPFVISENNFYGPYSIENGAVMSIHYGANNIPCHDGAVIFNRIHHGATGFATGGSFGVDNCIFIGNLFYDIKESYCPQGAGPLEGAAIQIGGSSGNIYITDNTIYDCDKGMQFEDLSSGDAVKIHGNIFNSITDVAAYEIETINTQEIYIDTDYNLYDAGASFLWAGSSRTLAYMQGTASEETNSVEGSPAFTAAASDDFTLLATSDAIGVSVEGPVGDTAYDAFLATFGIQIEKDFADLVRPQGGTWDIGAYEYCEGNGTFTVSGTLTIGP